MSSTEGVVPFLSFATNGEGMDAERSLDIFTQRVLIPLVVKTNAVVICTPTRACSLGMSFGKAASFLSSKYGSRAPRFPALGPRLWRRGFASRLRCLAAWLGAEAVAQSLRDHRNISAP